MIRIVKISRGNNRNAAQLTRTIEDRWSALWCCKMQIRPSMWAIVCRPQRRRSSALWRIDTRGTRSPKAWQWDERRLSRIEIRPIPINPLRKCKTFRFLFFPPTLSTLSIFPSAWKSFLCIRELFPWLLMCGSWTLNQFAPPSAFLPIHSCRLELSVYDWIAVVINTQWRRLATLIEVTTIKPISSWFFQFDVWIGYILLQPINQSPLIG